MVFVENRRWRINFDSSIHQEWLCYYISPKMTIYSRFGNLGIGLVITNFCNLVLVIGKQVMEYVYRRIA